MRIIKSLFLKSLPVTYRKSIFNYVILSKELAQFKTIKEGMCVDKNGGAIPWYTYPAIEYIKKWDLSQKSVFEFGSGYSTLFWAGIAKEVYSVEDDVQWYTEIKKMIPDNVDYFFRQEKNAYLECIGIDDKKFDIVIIDGNYRKECVELAMRNLTETGMIIFDNSDRHLEEAKALRNSGFIQVDMSGFGPINSYVWETSFFISRKFNFEVKNLVHYLL